MTSPVRFITFLSPLVLCLKIINLLVHPEVCETDFIPQSVCRKKLNRVYIGGKIERDSLILN